MANAASVVEPERQETTELRAETQWAAVATAEPAPGECLSLGTLAPGAELTIETLHSIYHVTVLNPTTGLALLRGGRLFTEPTRVRIKGACMGESAIKVGWLLAGFGFEFSVWNECGRTSPIRTIRVERM